MVDFSFQTRKLRDICEDESKANDAFGPTIAHALRKRLADLRASPSLLDMPTGNLRSAGENNSPVFIIDLSDDYILKFTSITSNIIKNDSDVVDLSDIYRIKLLSIEQANV